jgi:hypothetical protein
MRAPVDYRLGRAVRVDASPHTWKTSHKATDERNTIAGAETSMRIRDWAYETRADLGPLIAHLETTRDED